MLHRYNSFAELPLNLQERIRDFVSGDFETWVLTPIPALENRSFLSQLNEADGYQKISQYLLDVEGFLR